MAMTQKSFAQGTEFPPLTKEKLRIYSMRFCPYAQRTRLVLAHKNIPHEVVNVHLRPVEAKPDWFLKRNPLGLVPVLEQDDKVLCESLITSEYLDDAYPEKRLTPKDPYKKARDSMLIDSFGKKFTPYYYKVAFYGGTDEEAKGKLMEALNELEKEITARGKFFGGEQLALVDLMLWPWFERVPIMQSFAASLVPSADVFPKLFAWTQNMLKEECVKATCFDPDTHFKYGMSSKMGKPDYDMGLDP